MRLAANVFVVKHRAPADKYALLIDNFKYIRSHSDQEFEELYDIETDPFETSDLKLDRPDLVTTFRRDLESHLQRISQGDLVESEEVELSEAEKEQLRVLGYLH